MTAIPAGTLDHVRALPLVSHVECGALGAGGEIRMTITAEGHKHAYSVGILRTHLSEAEVTRWIGIAKAQPAGRPLMLLARHVSGPMGVRLREAGVQYVDQAGNMHVRLPPRRKLGAVLVALVEGKRPPRAKPADAAWRAPSYQVLLALLSRPELLAAPVRTIAAEAGVSTTPVLHVQAKLVERGWVSRGGTARRWLPRGRDKALDLWLHGYHTTLRPALLLGRYRPRPRTTVDELETQLTHTLGGKVPFWWGGAAAAYRLDAYYRGDRTVLHVAGEGHSTASLAPILGAVPDHDGPLVVLRLPGRAALDAADERSVHPLLAWAELLEEGHDRAGEAAARLEQRWRE